jgi:hypothetical protein
MGAARRGVGEGGGGKGEDGNGGGGELKAGAGGGAASPVSRGLPQKEPERGGGVGGRYLTVTAGIDWHQRGEEGDGRTDRAGGWRPARRAPGGNSHARARARARGKASKRRAGGVGGARWVGGWARLPEFRSRASLFG